MEKCLCLMEYVSLKTHAVLSHVYIASDAAAFVKYHVRVNLTIGFNNNITCVKGFNLLNSKNICNCLTVLLNP